MWKIGLVHLLEGTSVADKGIQGPKYKILTPYNHILFLFNSVFKILNHFSMSNNCIYLWATVQHFPPFVINLWLETWSSSLFSQKIKYWLLWIIVTLIFLLLSILTDYSSCYPSENTFSTVFPSALHCPLIMLSLLISSYGYGY